MAYCYAEPELSISCLNWCDQLMIWVHPLRSCRGFIMKATVMYSSDGDTFTTQSSSTQPSILRGLAWSEGGQYLLDKDLSRQGRPTGRLSRENPCTTEPSSTQPSIL